MGYFDNCRIDDRFTVNGTSLRWGDIGTKCRIYDWDQRRLITVTTAGHPDDEEFFLEAIAAHIDDLPVDTTLVEVTQDGMPTFHTSSVQEDAALVPFYPLVTDYPAEAMTVRRTELTEIERTGIQVDHATYKLKPGEEKHVIFKYYLNTGNIASVWYEANCIMRIPKHPNIVPFDRLVVDRIDASETDRVVGFTTPFIPGGTVHDNKTRLFKLKYLKQLFKVIDYLNHSLGIVHGDVSMRNLLIDEVTDNIQVFDFNWAAKLGWEGDQSQDDIFAFDEDRNDVKGVIFTVYETITRDTHFRDENYAHEQNLDMVTNIKTWKKHNDVRLDAAAVRYRELLDQWVASRKAVDKEVTHFAQIPGALDWPSLPKYPAVYHCGDMVERDSQLRKEMIERGEKFFRWERLPSCALPLPTGQRLLATGQVLNDTTGEIIAPTKLDNITEPVGDRIWN